MHFEVRKWSEIQPGNIIKFMKDQEAPADIVILHSSNQTGVVFVDTMNLDGETNLKEKNAIFENFDEKHLHKISGEIRCEVPNENLEKWDA
jgi:P-type E1-E2 ATPase